jgi:hypothetical protein
MAAWHTWDFLDGLATPKLVTRETAVLLMLAASLLVFRTLRERCLMVWIVGWVAYFVSHHAVAQGLGPANPYAVPIAHGEFILAVSLFVAGAFIYANARAFLAPLLAIGLALIAFATLQSIFWAHSETLRFAVELSYRILTLSAAVQILRFRRARREIGPWILAAGLLLLHLEWFPVSLIFLLIPESFRCCLAWAWWCSRVAAGYPPPVTLNALTTSIARPPERSHDRHRAEGIER